TLRAENGAAAPASYGIVGKVTSPSADADSAGVKGMNASTDPSAAGVVGKNTGGGPGLSAVVNPGAPPLKVNSDAKVANLDADLVDGLSSSDFVRAAQPGQVLSGRARAVGFSAIQDVVALPFATVRVQHFGPFACGLSFVNGDSSQTYDLMHQ